MEKLNSQSVLLMKKITTDTTRKEFQHFRGTIVVVIGSSFGTVTTATVTMWGTNLTSAILPLRHVQIDKRGYHSSFEVLAGIPAIAEGNITKKFHNPNFVNKHNPFVHCKYSSSQTPVGVEPQQVKSEEGEDPKSAIMGPAKKRNRRNRKRNKTARNKRGGENSRQQTPPVNVIQVYKRSVTFTISPPNRCWRGRQPSLCESEDSLVIVFEGDDDQNDSDTSSVDSQPHDQNSATNVTPTAHNATAKKVHFPSEDVLCVVHPMVKWSFAYQAARKGPWEEYARDRERFKQRISHSESVLGPILQKNHRDLIYEERYENKSGRETARV